MNKSFEEKFLFGRLFYIGIFELTPAADSEGIILMGILTGPEELELLSGLISTTVDFGKTKSILSSLISD